MCVGLVSEPCNSKAFGKLLRNFFFYLDTAIISAEKDCISCAFAGVLDIFRASLLF